MQLKNIPIPEAHIFGIVLGVLLHFFFKVKFFHLSWIGHLIGWPLIVLGIILSIWATIEVGKMEISSPQRLVTSGPYACSRNPMYVGWSLIYLGITFILNSIWLVVFFPLIMVYIHLIEITKEERWLEQKFGSTYRKYKNRVRKYM
ncbi:MAG: isoprenylcysteine carboxylmethyltransferase family protein [Anaerolineales bacterium]|jgi:protein-S-isoprenylcysteine O-methyltransferase Ste14